jgi:hypothetical protein
VEEAILADFTRFKGIVDRHLVAMCEKLEFTRYAPTAEIKVADK